MVPTKFAPDQASNWAPQVDALFYIISFLTIFFFVAVMGVVVFCAIKYRQGSNADRSKPQNENLFIEIAWSVPPLLLGLVIFAWGSILFVDMRRPPKNAVEIFVIGKQWMWHIQHPNGVREMNELHVPSGVPVKLTMISQDVIHAFYIPQFRAQFMVVPGRYTYEWFEPTKPGKYYLFCAMHCGSGHSEMGGYVYVMPPKDYQAWLDHGGSTPAPQQTLVQQGQEMYTQLSCSNCHKEQDSERAPSLYGIYNKTASTNNGPMLVTDEYIRNAIVSPYDKTVTGYTNTMPEYQRVSQTLPNGLTEEQLRGLVEYVKSLSNAATPTGSAPVSAAPVQTVAAKSSPSISATPAAKGATR
jgi:cytochrome c oxidase subunit 2